MHPLLILLCTCFASNNSFVGSKAPAKGGEQFRPSLIGDRDASHGHGHIAQQRAKGARSRKGWAERQMEL